MPALLEHINLTVPDPERTAKWMCDLFGWKVRWKGEAINGGFTVHVGSDDQYLAVYTGPGGEPQAPVHTSYAQIAGLNHVGVIVDDLDEVREKVSAQGYEPGEEYDYEPGRRFYFRDENNIEFEIVSYS